MAQKRLGSFLDEQMSTNVVVAESNQDCLHQLSLLGLSRESLPSCFGGTFRGWQPWRRSHHEQDHEGKAHHHHDGDHPQDDEYMLDIVADYPCLVRNTIWKYTQQSTATTTSTSTDAASARQSSDEAAAQGAKNAASAAPIPAKIEANKARVRDPNTATPSGKTGKKSTRKAIGGGNPKVGEEEDQKLKKRRLDAIYAQRKREKLRIETEVLQDQCKKANELSSSLRLENEKLEGLVYAAKQMVELYEQNKMLNASSSALPAAALNNGGAAYYPAAAWLQQPPSLLQQQQEQDFRMHKAALAALPPHQRQLLLAQAMQQQNAFAPPGDGMLR